VGRCEGGPVGWRRRGPREVVHYAEPAGGETDLADLWVRAAELMERLFRYAQGDGQDQVLLPDGDGSGSLFGQLGEVEEVAPEGLPAMQSSRCIRVAAAMARLAGTSTSPTRPAGKRSASE